MAESPYNVHHGGHAPWACNFFVSTTFKLASTFCSKELCGEFKEQLGRRYVSLQPRGIVFLHSLLQHLITSDSLRSSYG